MTLESAKMVLAAESCPDSSFAGSLLIGRQLDHNRDKDLLAMDCKCASLNMEGAENSRVLGGTFGQRATFAAGNIVQAADRIPG